MAFFNKFEFFIDFLSFMIYNIFAYAFIAQSVERRLGKAEVTGSIPVVGSNDESVRTFEQRYKYHSEKGWYFFNI